ncbi:MAG TPA: hypothetical protein VFT23_08190 [Burkholderiales bacterium]|nr:hypothetical protein [Burkholderiales bacterium]
MKRLIVTIDGQPAGAEQIREADRTASREYSAHGRAHRTAEKRAHRKLTDEQREEKRNLTAQRKREREAQRADREHQALMRRLKYAAARQAREAERGFQIKVKYKPGREPKFRTVCPRALFRRVHPFRPPMSNRPARTAADGFRNIVLKRICRGFGRRAPGTRSYQAGEASRAARYIARPEGIEDVEGAVLTNVLGPNLTCERSFSIEQQQQVAGFFDALESIERATGLSHVFSHQRVLDGRPRGAGRHLASGCSS